MRRGEAGSGPDGWWGAKAAAFEDKVTRKQARQGPR